MEKPLQIVLPVMLHFEEEVKTFRAAQQRLEALGQRYNIPINVGAFLLYLPAHSRKPESFAAQRKNQEKYGLPIRLVETGVEKANSLSYVKGDPTYNPEVQSDIDKVIEQVARLRDLDPHPLDSLVVAPQVGTKVLPALSEGDFSIPSFYSLKDFLNIKGILYQNARSTFDSLSTLAKKEGLVLALENAFPAVVENFDYWHDKSESPSAKHILHYQVFNDLKSLEDISGRKLVFDVAHFAAALSTLRLFEQNKDIVSYDALFATMGISSWSEYFNKIGELGDYLKQARAVHISQTDGIGIKVPSGTEEARRWGGAGELMPLVSPEVYHRVLKIAQQQGLPVSIEPEYSFKPLTYQEADNLLEPILQSYK